jgi:hypothetical protein
MVSEPNKKMMTVSADDLALSGVAELRTSDPADRRSSSNRQPLQTE